MALAHPRPSLRALGGALLTGLLLGSGAAVPAAHAVPTRAELRKKIDKQAAALKQVTEDYNAAREELAADEKTIAQLNKRLPGLRAQADGARAQFAEAASASYKISDLQQASVILADARGDEVMRRLGAIDQLTRRRQDKVGALTAAQRSLAADQQRLTTEAARQKIKVTDLRKRRDKIKKDLDDFYALRERAYGARDEGGGGYSGSVPKVSGQAGAVVTFAYRAIGKPYRFGEAGPDGYDCSGLT
ncbi:MAG TPA: glycoside hydrolase, partial [Pilimelia sp.]|nr:glycoside hydrolase [Pilimelia sp.]